MDETKKDDQNPVQNTVSGDQKTEPASTGSVDLNVLAESSIKESFVEPPKEEKKDPEIKPGIKNIEKQEAESEDLAKGVEKAMNGDSKDSDILAAAGVTVVDDPVVKDSKNIKSVHKSENKIKTKELEDDFQTTISNSKPNSSGIKSEMEELKDYLNKIKAKISESKIKIKERIDALKREKEGIQKELNHIKELEETQHKIEQKMTSIEDLDKEIDSLEEEAKRELAQ